MPDTQRTIRSLFATRRPIDRPIEKVISYQADEPSRLLTEIEEYEITDSLEHNFRRFLDVYDAGVRANQVTEIGVWVSGFYGSGKSSFTKYLGFALDPNRVVDGRPFVEHLAERIGDVTVRQNLRTLARQQPATVITLDLGAEQLASSATTTVSTVLYWKVLQWAGYSREEKLAYLEFLLDRDGKLEAFRQAYAEKFGGRWEDIHDDPLLGVARADQIVPQFYPREFPTPGVFRTTRFQMVEDLRERAEQIVDLVRRRTGRQNVIFLIDEAGQYVAPRGELILNLDGLTRNFKEDGRGRVWVVATAQQTLREIVERAAYNSDDLVKLQARFPIAIELDAQDIREITWRRLLTKSAAGEAALAEMFRRDGQSLVANTRLTGTTLYRADPGEESFRRLYPFLPQHFDLLLDLVRALARSTIGLRSAIRVIQDLLVDTSRVLPPGTPVLADAPVGRLATADLFFDALRADIGKVLPHVPDAVDRAARALPGDILALRAAKAIGALQAVERFPRSVENVAALLNERVGDPPHVDAVRAAIRRLLDNSEIGLVEDPQSGGLVFLSDKVRPLRERRDCYIPGGHELSLRRSLILKSLFQQAPSTTLEGAKAVRAGVKLGNVGIVGEDEEVQFRIEATDATGWDRRRESLLTDTTGNVEWKNTVAWLIRPDPSVDDVLVQAVKSTRAIEGHSEAEADRDVAQFIRAERRAAESYDERTQKLYRQALLDGTLIFRGEATPAAVAGGTVEAAAQAVLQRAAAAIYQKYHLLSIRPPADLATKFLRVERLDRIPGDADPLHLVTVTAGRPRVDIGHPALDEALRELRRKLEDGNSGRLLGSAVLDLFASPPYGWSKDATRYLFAALLRAGGIVLYAANGVVHTSGPTALEAFDTNRSFGRTGVALREGGPTNEELDRAARRLEDLSGEQVLPDENEIGRAVREHVAPLLDALASLPTQLRLLGLPGVDRAQTVLDTGRDLSQQDGAGAVTVLGAPDCNFPADLQWAEAAARALERGAEREVQTARGLIQGADELARLFPDRSPGVGALVTSADRETLNDVLGSDTFYDRLADLRTTARTVRERAASTYRGGIASYRDELEAALARLEARPEWLRVSDEDRAELADRLRLSLPEGPAESQEMSQLQLLFLRQAELPRLEAELARELERRVPTETQPETVLDLGSLLPAEPLRNAEDLAAWLDSLRARVEAALAAEGNPVRLRVSR